jgi:hypothetical protein
MITGDSRSMPRISLEANGIVLMNLPSACQLVLGFSERALLHYSTRY